LLESICISSKHKQGFGHIKTLKELPGFKEEPVVI
jgi:hypothetical protein